MFYYVPRLHHAIITAFICIILIALCGWRGAKGWVLVAFLFGAFGFAVITAVVLWLLYIQAVNERLDKMLQLARLYGEMDEEARQAFAFQFPSMQYRMKRGEVRAYFEDTNVPIEMFHYFLQTSDAKYISPRRYWYTHEHPEWAWTAIQQWLLDNDKIYPDSAAGSHSWMWKGNSWAHLKAYWGAGMRLVDMDDEIVIHDPGYTPPPQREEVGAD